MGVDRPALLPAWTEPESRGGQAVSRSRSTDMAVSMLTGLIRRRCGRPGHVDGNRDRPSRAIATALCTQASPRLHLQPPDDKGPCPHDSTKALQIRFPVTLLLKDNKRGAATADVFAIFVVAHHDLVHEH